MKYKKIVIVGMGLIGGSIGRTLMEKGISDEVVGIFRRSSSMKKALKQKVLTKGYVDEYDRAVTGADIIIIATPVDKVPEIMDSLSRISIGKRTIVTDAGSTKREIADHSLKYGERFVFVGSHPLAGSEKTGVENSFSGLFQGSTCVITPIDGKRGPNVNRLVTFWKAVGVRKICVMTPEEHDAALAISSHFPHLAAYALAGLLDKKTPKALFSSGFKDTTRIASSDPMLWAAILMSNRKNVIKCAERYKHIISEMQRDLMKKNVQGLEKKISEFKGLRDAVV